MTKDELKNLRKLRKEREDLERRIRHHTFSPKEELADTVKDYRTGYGKTIIIRGYGDTNWAKLQDQYRRKEGDIARKIMQMEKFLDTVQDPEMRTILRMRYEDGMTHEQIGKMLGWSQQAVEKKERRFWSDSEK